MKFEKYTKIILDDGRTATIVDFLGKDYIVDINLDNDYDTILVKEENIKGIATSASST